MKSRRTRTRLPAASVSVVASGSRTRSRSGCASVSVFSFRSSHCAANRASERTRRGLLRRDPQAHRIEHEILSRSRARLRHHTNRATPNRKGTAVTFDLNFNSIKKKCKVKKRKKVIIIAYKKRISQQAATNVNACHFESSPQVFCALFLCRALFCEIARRKKYSNFMLKLLHAFLNNPMPTQVCKK